ncbi:MAG: glycoside hydrolase family 25 protein [Lachnospiraceae bacterium]|nr:glycoside hydrolase family 25 protein [Lachnospiraceae bacterium]
MSVDRDINEYIEAEEIPPVRVMQGDDKPKKSGKGKKIRQRLNLQRLISALLAVLLIFTAFFLYQSSKRSAELEKKLKEAVLENEAKLSATDAGQRIEAAREEGLAEGRQALKDEIMEKLCVPETSSAEVLRRLYDDYIYYVSDNTYHFVRINEELPKHGISKSELVADDNGFFDHYENGTRDSLRVVDVSQFQKKGIDWDRVKAAGVDGCMIRVGFRGYGSGALVEDDCFEENIKKAAAAGLKTGVYFFTQAIDTGEAVEEAEFVLDRIKGHAIELPVALDVEVPGATARANTLTPAERTDAAEAFLKRISEAGYTPMIYVNTYGMFGMLDVERAYKYPIWFAFYSDYIYYPYEVKMWQYTEAAEVDGISGGVDMNVFFQ